ncbi:MAG: CGNR zinc finger domain-containing protein [Solirubrobacterales bacterium]
MSSEVQKNALRPEIDLLVDFVNTRDLEEETDAIADPDLLRAWIGEHAGEYLPELEHEDLQRVLEVREALRALLRTNNGGEVGESELEPLREAAERSRYRLAFGPDGNLSLAPARADLSGFESRLLLAIERLQCEDAWPRLKACTDEGCQWVFYDATRNRSRTWCSMDVCGNREKTKRYRQRNASH